MSKEDLTGKQFGYITVLGRDKSSIGERNSKWFCRCKCGKITSMARCSLESGHTTSCGCKIFESHNATHGMTKTRLHSIWSSMKNRCTNHYKKNKYVPRGITVCDEWKSDFMAFYIWAINNGYSDNLTIDRIDNNKNYCPENCRWISIAEQQSNKTNTVWIDYQGSKRCLRTVCMEIGFPYKTAHCRYQRITRRGELPTFEKLFEPIHEEKISKCFRHP